MFPISVYNNATRKRNWICLTAERHSACKRTQYFDYSIMWKRDSHSASIISDDTVVRVTGTAVVVSFVSIDDVVVIFAAFVLAAETVIREASVILLNTLMLSLSTLQYDLVQKCWQNKNASR